MGLEEKNKAAIDIVTSLDVSNSLIQTLEGIQDFTSLITLKCENNLLTSLNLTRQSIGEMNIEPKVFSPNNDGYHDVVAINWNFSKTNLMATIRIFDSNGRAVKTLVNNEMIGNSGSKNWDGTSEEGLQLATGIYVVWMEVFSQNAVVERYKKVAVLNR